jgi:hypothetical protein
VVIAIAFLGIFPFLGGNYSEEYSLVFQIGILSLLFSIYLPNRRRLSRPLASVGMGLLVGLVFCVKQTYLDIPITVLVFIVFLAWVEKDRRILGNILLVGLGFLLVNLPIFLYFQLNGALRDYVIDAFLFNFYYSELTSLERANSLLDKLQFIASHPFFFLVAGLWLGALCAWLIQARHMFVRIMDQAVTRRLTVIVTVVCLSLFLVAQVTGGDPQIGRIQGSVLAVGIFFGVASLLLFLRKAIIKSTDVLTMDALRRECLLEDWRYPGPAALLFLGLLDFPIVLFSIALSGKAWTHYYITLFPAMILIMAGSLAYLYQHPAIQMKKALLNSLLSAVLVVGSIPPLRQIANALSQPKGEDARSVTAAYLKSVTTPEDTILVWGWESVIYFLAERGSPTRFALPFAFYLDTPYLDEYADILLEEVTARPPAYIADLMDPSMPFIGGRPAETCLSGNQMGTQKLVDFLGFICANYEPDRNFDEINVYKLRVDQ